MADAPVVASRVVNCDGCGAGLWMALSSPPVDRMFCNDCACEAVEKDGEEPQLNPASKQQREEFKRVTGVELTDDLRLALIKQMGILKK
jgi:hypothetical protein